ncbi:MerR family transcriptional regulator [Paeniglutamicibacter psychrophenolicus]|uniref:MerR family transcriptional regulator n=1 Tax=Paeniglutamicibacter psychrophenolicus TaxID=257454 RepID=UPI002788A9F8|nr:MerR family transcriptional regulator [Paeniglutamicibacter psychrophenolicus]MDQ0096239.1 DNA-binding transcriptional MerR regulator [Paeniglutamicibacter psychrophenolicus]
MNHEKLLSIGAFAQATMLSPKALRLYGDRGLLVPVSVDRFTGYRYYDPGQRSRGRMIAMLRAASMPLEDISRLLDLGPADPEGALEQLAAYESAVRNNTESTSTLLAAVRAHLKGQDMDNVNTVLEPERHLVSIMLHTFVDGLDTGMKQSLERLQAFAAAEGLAVTGDPFGIFHQEITPDSDGPLEVCLPVDGLSAGTHDAQVRSYRLAGGRYASIRVSGAETAFPAILAAYDQTCTWVEEAGATAVGPPHEIWHVLPWADEPADMTVAWPYA